MLARTHVVITLFFILLLIPFISYKLLFVLLGLFMTYVPDIDLKNSKLGKKKIFRPLQFFFKHRGFFHSFTFLILATLFFSMFVPILALGFFIGYASHLFADSFTPEGIYLFYPLTFKSKGKIKTGGKSEFFIFLFFSFVDLLLIFKYMLVS